ncbi:hypothetical protein [Colwellia chukchiensis]|nr:hypothetical protein [Colwellia chukchiensis]
MKKILVVFFLLFLTNIKVNAATFKASETFTQLKAAVANNDSALAW